MAQPNIIFSLEEGGEAIVENFDLGEGGFNGDWPDETELWIRHDGNQPITNVRLYVAPFSGNYIGQANPQDDYDELIDGGDEFEAEGGSSGDVPGYLQIATNDDLDNWQTVTSEDSPPAGSELVYAINLGAIESGESIRIGLRIRFFLETDPAIGVRQLDLRCTYTFTD